MFQIAGRIRLYLVYLSPFVSTTIAPVQSSFATALLSRGDLNICRLAFGTNCMVEMGLQRIDDETGLGVIIPKHAKVSNADRGH